jgi:hypothetical protein
VESDFDWDQYIEYFIPGHSIYRVLTSRITTFSFDWDSFLFKVIENFIYNLDLTRRGINIIESDFDWNEYIEYFIIGNSM